MKPKLIQVLAAIFIGLHVSFTGILLFRVARTWNMDITAGAGEYSSLLSNHWFRLTLFDNIARSGCLALLLPTIAGTAFAITHYYRRPRVRDGLLLFGGLLPLLLSFTLSVFLWGVLLLGRSLDGFRFLGLPLASPEVSVWVALSSRYLPICLLVMYTAALGLSHQRTDLVRTNTASLLRYAWMEAIPVQFPRGIAAGLLVFVLASTDPVATGILGGGKALSLAGFVLERFRANDPSGASAATIATLAVNVLVVSVGLLVMSRHAQES